MGYYNGLVLESTSCISGFPSAHRLPHACRNRKRSPVSFTNCADRTHYRHRRARVAGQPSWPITPLCFRNQSWLPFPLSSMAIHKMAVSTLIKLRFVHGGHWRKKPLSFREWELLFRSWIAQRPVVARIMFHYYQYILRMNWLLKWLSTIWIEIMLLFDPYLTFFPNCLYTNPFIVPENWKCKNSCGTDWAYRDTSVRRLHRNSNNQYGVFILYNMLFTDEKTN